MIRPPMIRIPRKRPTPMGKGMTMQQFADLVCNKQRAQVLATINKPTDQPKGLAK
jgi:hypothetical protein